MVIHNPKQQVPELVAGDLVLYDSTVILEFLEDIHARAAFRAGELELGFVTAITAFSAPQNVTLDEIRIESYFPIDQRTRELCEQLAQGAIVAPRTCVARHLRTTSLIRALT